MARFRHRKGEFVGWEAQMIQHMADHCAGKLVLVVAFAMRDAACALAGAGRTRRLLK